MKKTVMVLTLAAALCSPMAVHAGKRGSGASSSQGSLPFTPQPRDPQSTAYAPYFGFESQRRQQETPISNCQQYDRGYHGREQGRDHGRGHGGGSKGRR